MGPEMKRSTAKMINGVFLLPGSGMIADVAGKAIRSFNKTYQVGLTRQIARCTIRGGKLAEVLGIPQGEAFDLAKLEETLKIRLSSPICIGEYETGVVEMDDWSPSQNHPFERFAETEQVHISIPDLRMLTRLNKRFDLANMPETIKKYGSYVEQEFNDALLDRYYHDVVEPMIQKEAQKYPTISIADKEIIIGEMKIVV